MENTKLFCLFCVINILLIIPVSNAQNSSASLIEEVFEDISVNNEDEELDFENELQELSERFQEPVNLNTATKEQLEQFPFLKDIQIEHLLAYIDIHGQMQTIYELQLVEDMDKRTIDYLLPFVCVLPAKKEQASFQWKNLLKYGKHEALSRFDMPLYIRKGYEKTYLGPSVYNSLKYGFRYREQIYVGITAEKDAGEPLGALHNKRGYDYYSFYFLLRNIGWLKTLAIGNYRLSFGQGLVVSTDYLLGKTVYSSSFRSTGIKKHSSTDEYNYFRGAAVAVSLAKQWTLSGFYSHRSMDGVIEGGEITSIYKTGLHRSQKEADKKELFTLQLTGSNLAYQHNNLKLGVTGIYYVFNYSYEPVLKGYSKYNLHGNNFYNLGIDYSYRWRRFSFQGETATGKQGLATLNRLQYSPAQGYQLTVVHRYYSYDYWAMFARSFGEGSGVQNENGWYLAAEAAPFRHWRFGASLDMFSFPWWKYRISKPSQGVDGLFQTDYSPRKNLTMYVRYRYKQKERDVSGTEGKTILTTFHHQFRYRLNYSSGEMFSFRTTCDYNHFHSLGEPESQGYQVSQMISYRLPWIPLQVEIQGGYFNTSDYDSRVYVQEKGLLHTFYTPSFQGEGIRLVAYLRYDMNRHWMLLAKFGQTVYQDCDEIGSGNDLISGNKKADIQMQLRIKF